jgi:tetratricopeptide (TPR) repeat protein
MGYLGSVKTPSGPGLPDRTISPFSFSLCAAHEQTFIKACDYLMNGNEYRAHRLFTAAARGDANFLDAWFMVGMIELVNGRAERARQAFLRILQKEYAFQGYHVLRFLPTFRAFANLYEDLLFQVMPTTEDVAAMTARMYLIEGRNREAKKIIHPAFREYNDSPAVQAIWAQSMLADNAPEQVIKELEQRSGVRRGMTELDVLVMVLIGQAHMNMGDFRAGICRWEGSLHSAQGKNPHLFDGVKIKLAVAFEGKGYLLDCMDVLSSVNERDSSYDSTCSVRMKMGELADRLETYKRQGIVKCMRFFEEHEFPKWRQSEDFLEIRPSDRAS